MTTNQEKVFAFIDGQNLNMGPRSQGWILDFRKFRKLLAENIVLALPFILSVRSRVPKILIKSGELRLGTWQRIVLVEFGGPKDRRVIVS